MTQKILLADDSLTIQKVIKITLANEPYTIVECANAQDLEKELSKSPYDLVLLDYTLSEEMDGHELAKKVLSLSPQSKVVMLYGTFDTIDEQKLKLVGVSNKIIKPFDSTQFIHICREVLNSPQDTSFRDHDLSSLENESTSSAPSMDQSSQWKIETRAQSTGPAQKLPSETPAVAMGNSLNREMLDWGVEVPGVIGMTEDSSLELPPIIEESDEAPFLSKAQVSVDELPLEIETFTASGPEDNTDPRFQINKQKRDKISNFPKQEDLEYPEIGSVPNLTDDEIKVSYEPDHEVIEGPSIMGPRNFEGKITSSGNDPKGLSGKLQDQVYDEDLSKNFWSADLGEPAAPTFSQVDLTKLAQELRPMIEEMVKKYCQETVEKIAWEILPDLAENLIKQELAKISSQVLKGPQ